MNIFSTGLSDRETDVFLELMRAIGCSTPDQLLKACIVTQARLSDVECPADLFTRRPITRPEPPEKKRKGT